MKKSNFLMACSFHLETDLNSAKRGETLANYYVRTYFHLIPVGVEIWEYDETVKIAEKLLFNKGLNHTG